MLTQFKKELTLECINDLIKNRYADGEAMGHERLGKKR